MKYFITALILVSTLFCRSQGFRVRHYLPGALNNSAKAIFESSPGNYITGGISHEQVNGFNTNRLCIMGLDAQGQLQWTKKYGNHKFEYLDNTLIGRSYFKEGNFVYYTGCARDSNNKYVGVLIKLDLNGDTLWQKIYRDTAEDVIPQMVTRSVDGGFLMTGFFQNWTTNANPVLLIKTDNYGNELWRKRITKLTPNTHDGKSIVQDSASKKIVIVGYQYLGNSSSWSGYDNILVLDSLGVKLEQKNFVGLAGGYLKDLIQTKDGNFVAVGFAVYPVTLGASNLIKPYVVKFDINDLSSPIWKINYYGQATTANAYNCVVEMPNEDLLIGGGIDTLTMHNMPTNCLTRFTTIGKNGNILNERLYDYNTTPGDFNEEGIVFLSLTNDGGWAVALHSTNFPSPNPFHFVKYDSDGCDSTLYYCQSVVLGLNDNLLTHHEYTFFPNPASSKVSVRLSNAEEKMELVLSDLYGRMLKKILFSAMSREISMDLSDVANGIYMLSVRKNSKTLYTSKLVKQD